jgi:hypothetical protein
MSTSAAADALGAPEAVFDSDAADERDDFSAETDASRRLRFGVSSPEEAEEVTVPPQERLGLDEHEALLQLENTAARVSSVTRSAARNLGFRTRRTATRS